MNDFEKIYFNELKMVNKKYPLLTKEQEIELCERMKKGVKKAEETFILSNLNLVIKVVSKLHISDADKLDLIQDGNVALIEKAHCYDYNKGARFGTFIWQWIWDGIIKNNIVLSERDNRIMRKIQKIQEEYFSETGESADSAKIAELLNMSEEDINKKLQLIENANRVSLNSPNNVDGENEVSLDMMELDNPYGAIDYELMRSETKKIVQKAIQRLPAKEQLVIKQRYMNSDDSIDKVCSLRNVAAKICMTSEGVRVIEKRAIEQLKITLKREGVVA